MCPVDKIILVISLAIQEVTAFWCSMERNVIKTYDEIRDRCCV